LSMSKKEVGDDHQAWTAEEEHLLMAYNKVLGNNWESISEKLSSKGFPKRTYEHLQKRKYTIVRRLKRQTVRNLKLAAKELAQNGRFGIGPLEIDCRGGGQVVQSLQTGLTKANEQADDRKIGPTNNKHPMLHEKQEQTNNNNASVVWNDRLDLANNGRTLKGCSLEVSDEDFKALSLILNKRLISANASLHTYSPPGGFLATPSLPNSFQIASTDHMPLSTGLNSGHWTQQPGGAAAYNTWVPDSKSIMVARILQQKMQQSL